MTVARSAFSSGLTDPSCRLLDGDGSAVALLQLLDEADAWSSRLEVEPGERVLLLVPPGIAWARAFFAILAAGAVAVPVCLTSPARELAYIAKDSAARLAIASPPFRALLSEAAALHAEQSPLRVIDAFDLEVDEPTLRRSRPRAASPADLALLLYTSGTTGSPKGVMLSHANLIAQTEALRAAWALGPNDVVLHALPMHHLHGVVVAFLTALRAGASVTMLPKFDAAAVLEGLKRASVWMAVPTMYERLVSLLEARGEGVRGLRLATSGSAALPASLAKRWQRLAGSIPLERYGMTEIGIALSNPLDPALRRVGFVGAPLPSVQTRIVNEQGVDVGDDEPGELWVRGPSVMAGYLGREAETRASFTAGWFRTGDIALRNAGSIRLLGRASTDILKSGGEKVSALEVEEALREHPAIAEIAVLGVPDEEWGERVVAVITAREGRAAECRTELLRAWAKERLAGFKVPKQFVLLASGQSLPRNAMGKVLKSELSALVRGAAGGSS